MKGINIMSSSLFDLHKKVALVTGSGRGLGKFFSLALAKSGADLIIADLNIESLSSCKEEIEKLGRKVFPVTLDVKDLENISDMVESAHAFYGKIDILVNNAGCNIRKPALEITKDEWDKIIDTNLTGTFFTSQAVAKKMITAGYGRIINIGSVTTVFGYAGISPYCASKGGVKQLTMSLADDWGKYGITVNCLSPGWIYTEQTKTLFENKYWVNYINDRIPLKRTGTVEDLEGLLIFLASDASSYVTGQTILVDGGISTGATKAEV